MLFAAAIIATTLLPSDGPKHVDDRSSHSSNSVAVLIRDLSEKSFTKRESASETLRAIGQPALRELIQASDSRSEVGERASQISRRIQHDLLTKNSTAAIHFDLAAAQTLPMWDRFRVPNLPDEERAKQLGEMTLAIASTRALDGLPPLGGQYDSETSIRVMTTVYRRLTERSFSYSAREERTATALATLLFGGHPNTVLHAEDGLLLRTVLSNADAATLLRDSRRRPTIEWLVRNFVENLPNDGKVHALPTVLTHRLSHTAPLCRVVLTHSVTPNQLAQAAAALSLSGDRSDVEYLRPLLDRTHLIRSNGFGTRYVRLNDVALYASIVLTKQSPESYGLQSLPSDSSRGFNYAKVQFSSQAARARGHKKWEEWQRNEFRTPLPPPRDAIHGQRL